MKGGTSYGGKSHWLHEKSTYNLDGHRGYIDTEEFTCFLT